MRGFYLWIAILACLFVFLPKSVQAETVRVTISADEINYDYDSKQIEAAGNVQISYKETKVESDYALIDHDQNILLATGKVKVIKDGDEFSGDRFLYYLETQQGWVYPVITEVTDEEIKGTVRFTASEAFIKGEELLFKKTNFTSCDLDKPHYHFTAGRIEYYPEKRIKMYGVWYWEHRVKLLYLPVLFISLEEDSNNFGAQVGYNSSDGWWILSWYTYYFNDNNSLMIQNKTTEIGIDWWEVQHINKFAPSKKFTETFRIEDKDKVGIFYDDYKFGLKYEDYSHPKLNYDTWLNGWNRYTVNGESYLESEYAFSLKGQSPYPSVQFYYDIKEEEGLPQARIKENWSYNFNESLNISLGGEWFYSERDLEQGEPKNKMDYNFGLQKRWAASNLAIKVHEQNIYTYDSENVIPDITYTVPKWKWPIVGDVKVISQYTHKEKISGVTDLKTEGERSALDVQKNISLWERGSLGLSSDTNFRYRDYLVEENATELTALTEQFTLNNKFTAHLSTKVSTGFTEVEGENNSFFNESVLPGADLWNEWIWSSGRLNANLKTGYNFETEYAYPIEFNSIWNSDSTRINLSIKYYQDNGMKDSRYGLGETSLVVDSTPRKDWHLSTILNYSFLTESWSSKRMDLQLSEEFAANWRAELKINYDMMINDFANANISLIYNWHCRDLEIHYDWIERQYWIQLTFKAFPQARFNTSENPWEYLNYE